MTDATKDGYATKDSKQEAKAKLTPEQEAKNDAKDIHNSLQHDNASAAYDLMLKEITAAKTDFKPGSKDFVAYRNTLTNELKESNDVLDLAPIWGQKAFNKLTITNNSGKHSDTISQRELSPYVNGALPTDGLTKSFASALREQIKDNSVSYDQLGKLSKEGETKRNQATVSEKENSQTKKYAELFESKTKTGKSLLQLADAAGAVNNPENIDGKVTKQDIDALIKLGKAGLTPLREWELAHLNNLSANWDKPEVKNLRKSINANGVEVQGDSITAESLSLAKHPGQAKAEAEEAAIDNADHKALATRNNVELLLEHKTGTGKSLIEAADYIGGNGHTDKSVGKQDIDALLQASHNGLVKVSEADQRALKSISDGWNTDPAVLALRQLKSKDEVGDPITTTAQYITPDSLKLANGDVDREAQQHNAEQSKRLDETSVSVRKEAVDYSRQLETLKFGKNNLFTAADIHGATKDGIINNDQVDHKIDSGDLKKLASVLIASNGADSPEYKLVTKLIADWDTPAVRAMRAGNDYITPESMKSVALF